MASYNKDERNVHGIGREIETKLPENPTFTLPVGKIFVLREIRFYVYSYDERITRETVDRSSNILADAIMRNLDFRIAKIALEIPFAWVCDWKDIVRMAGKL